MATDRSPFQIVVLVFCVLTGAVGLLTGSASMALQNAFNGSAWVWNAAVLVGSVASLVALWCPAPTNYLLERAGMLLLATAFTVYGIAVVAVIVDPARSVVGVGTTLALAIACGVRAVQLTTRLKLLRQALRDRGAP